jgi:hypothetical protein
MTNYGYGPGTQYWKASRKDDLAVSLQNLLLDMEKTGKFDGLSGDMSPIQGEVVLRGGGGHKPYIEIDGLYPGVCIRKTTHLKPEVEDELIHRADNIYLQIMKRQRQRRQSKQSATSSSTTAETGDSKRKRK